MSCCRPASARWPTCCSATWTISTPSLVEGAATDLLRRVSSEGVVFIYVNFVLRGRQVRGYIALLMDLVAFTALKRLVGDFVRRETE